MPTRNINLTPAMEGDEKEQAAKLEALRTAIREGESSGIAEHGVFDRILASLDQTPDLGTPID